MHLIARTFAGLVGTWIAFAIALAADAPGDPAAWKAVAVPGPMPAAGTAWYRAWVKVPDSYFSQHERNLFEESVGVNIRDLAGAHEVWVNGKMIGTGGSFPPAFRSGADAVHRHKVPVGTLMKGGWNEISIRIHQPPGAGPGGFLGDAPFIMDYFLEAVLAGPWQSRAGEGHTPGGALTERPATATFDRFKESSRVLGRAEQVHGPKLPPAGSAAKMRPAPDLATDLLLSEPLVAQPTHFSFDGRGRLWVAQYRQYPYPAGLKMLSRDKYYRAHYDKVPPPPPGHDHGADIISVHEDTDGDGVHDRHKIFLEGLNMANSVVVGRGGVWVMHTPYLLFYPDRDGDDVPDGPPEVRLAGFGFEDTHSVANGLLWGPDGWLYGGQGSTTSCRVVRPGLDPADSPGVYFEGCMVWRYHPDTRAFEIFAEGGGNTFGLGLDDQGRLHSGHNGGGTRGWHFVQGGFFPMQGLDPGKFGPARDPYAFGELPMMRTSEDAVRFTHFGATAGGTAIPAAYQGLLFSLDPLHNVVLTSERRLRGSTFETVDRAPAVRSDDETFRPLYIANAPDGSLFVSDMCEFYIAHGQHYQNQIDPTSGRIYRLRGKDGVLEKDNDLEHKSTARLVALLTHPDRWHRSTAVQLLGERKDPEAAAPLKELIARDRGLGALGALWALHQSIGLDPATALAGLAHPYAPVRMWTARVLGDERGLQRNLGIGRHARGPEPGTMPAALHAALVAQAGSEADAEVLSQFASTARRLEASQALPLVAAVLAHDEATGDPYIPLLCWWVFEAHLPTAADQVLALLREPALWDRPMVFQHLLPRLARRFAVEGKRADLLHCARLFRQAPSPRHAAQLMKGFEEAYRGRAMTGLPDELAAAIAGAGRTPLAFRLRQGDADAIAEALRRMQDAGAPADERLVLVRTFGETQRPEAVDGLLAIASTDTIAAPLRKAAFASLSSYDETRIGSKALAMLPGLVGETRTAAATLLSSRIAWSLRLLEAVRDAKVPSGAVPKDVADRLRSSKDKAVAGLAERLFPATPTPPLTGDARRRVEEIGAILRRAPGDPYAGEATFLERCGGCHKLFFKGGAVGPDLTPYQRDNLATLLPSIVDPDAEIREGFQCYTVETRDGRTLSGFFVDRDNQVTVLRGLDGENVTLRSADIAEMRPLGRSLMPSGLLDGLTDPQLRDLFAYLRISQPITR